MRGKGETLIGFERNGMDFESGGENGEKYRKILKIRVKIQEIMIELHMKLCMKMQIEDNI